MPELKTVVVAPLVEAQWRRATVRELLHSTVPVVGPIIHPSVRPSPMMFSPLVRPSNGRSLGLTSVRSACPSVGTIRILGINKSLELIHVGRPAGRLTSAGSFVPGSFVWLVLVSITLQNRLRSYSSVPMAGRMSGNIARKFVHLVIAKSLGQERLTASRKKKKKQKLEHQLLQTSSL